MHRPHSSKTGFWRALVAVGALYGLLLQAILSPLVPHIQAAIPGSAVCAPNGAGDGSGHGTPPAHRAACCLVVCDTMGAPLAEPRRDAVTAPAVETSIAVWQPIWVFPPTGPPAGSHSPRGPPEA